MIALYISILQVSQTLEFGPEKAPRIVLIAGDEEYRSEEMLPQLAKILSKHHGFRTTVILPQNAKGEIDPENQTSAPGIETLDQADLCILMIRFRQWSDQAMSHFVRYFESGKPFIAIRTTTHPFFFPPSTQSPYQKFNWNSKDWQGGFGKQVFGETWVSHWGNHGIQATKGVPVAKTSLLNGVDGLFGTTDVYEANPPPDAQILMRGTVLESLKPDAQPAEGRKKTQAGVEQELNNPMMPIVWTREGKNRILTTTFGSATDFLDQRFRRLLVNATYWSLKKRIPTKAKVDIVGTYSPTEFGFGKFKRGRTLIEHKD